MYYLLYEITNLVNGKNYIGQHITKNINDGYIGSGRNIKKAIKKYGKENFKKEILLYAKNEVALNFFERALVTPEFCELKTNYNLKEGGSNGRHSKTTKDKLSIWHKGRKHTTETKAKISAANKGRKHSPESKAKISTALKNRDSEIYKRVLETKKKNKTTNNGKRHTAETKAKISATKKGKVSNRKGVKLSAETKLKISLAARRRNQLLKTLI